MKHLHNTTARRYSYFLSFFLSFFLLTISSSTSRAGCPTDIYPTASDPGYVAWTSTTQSFVLASGCIISVKLCTRLIGDTRQFYIDEFKPLSGPCDVTPVTDILNEIRGKIFFLELDEPPPCNQPAYYISLYTGACISFIMQDGAPICRMCPEAYCAKKCRVCKDGSTKTIDQCTYFTLGNPDCETFSGDINEVTLSSIEGPAFYNYLQICYLFDCGNY